MSAFRLCRESSLQLGGPESEAPFVLQLSLNCDGTRLAAALSDCRIRLFDAGTLGHVGDVYAKKACGGGALRSICWASKSPLRLWMCTSAGGIACWNCVTGSVECLYKRDEAPTGMTKRDSEKIFSGPFSLAITHADDTLAAGVGNAIHFWDLRAGSQTERTLGVYRDAHAQQPPSYGTVRHLAFHPVVPHTLLSGGDDGVVNVFDLSIKGDDDALVSVLNVGSSVATMGFFGENAALLWVITEMGGLSLWNFSSAERIADFPHLRMQVLEAGLPLQYFLGCLPTGNLGGSAASSSSVAETLTLVAGSDDGNLVSFEVGPSAVVPRDAWQGSSKVSAAARRHTAIVRCLCAAQMSAANSRTVALGHVVFSGGEDGRVCQWIDERVEHTLQAYPSMAVRIQPPLVDASGAQGGSSNSLLTPAALTAAVFGSRDADPVSDAEEGVPSSAELLALLAEPRPLGGSAATAARPGGGAAAEAAGVDDDVDEDMANDGDGSSLPSMRRGTGFHLAVKVKADAAHLRGFKPM